MLYAHGNTGERGMRGWVGAENSGSGAKRFRDWVSEREFLYLLFRALDGHIVALRKYVNHNARHLRCFGFAKAARREGGRAEADAGGIHRFTRIVRDRVFVQRDTRAIEEK